MNDQDKARQIMRENYPNQAHAIVATSQQTIEAINSIPKDENAEIAAAKIEGLMAAQNTQIEAIKKSIIWD